MSRLSTMLTALADTALAVVAGLLVPLTVASAGWLISGGFQQLSWQAPLAATMALWSLGLTGAIGITIQPQNYPNLGLTEPFTFVVSLAPLAITAVYAWAAWRCGRRIATSDEDHPWSAIALSTLAFSGLSYLALTFGATKFVQLDRLSVLLGGTSLWLVALLIGARSWQTLPWKRVFGNHSDRVLGASGYVVRLAAGFVVGILTLAGVFVAIGLVAKMGQIVGLTQLLQLDAWGNISVGLIELMYLPTLLVWAAAWLLGAGVQLGSGSLASPGGTDAGPLPAVPLLGVIPEPNSPLWWSVCAVAVLLTVLLTMWLRRGARQLDACVWWQRMIVPAAAGVLAAGGMSLLALLARGALGPGRLAEFGPQPGRVFLAAFAVFVGGALIGAFVPIQRETAPAGLALWPQAAPSGIAFRTQDARANTAAAGSAQAANAIAEEPADALELNQNSAASTRSEPEPNRTQIVSDTDTDKSVASPRAAETPQTGRKLLSRAGIAVKNHAGTRSNDDAEGPAKRHKTASPLSHLPRRRGGAAAGSLAEAVRRPGEPDIYADLDDDEPRDA